MNDAYARLIADNAELAALYPVEEYVREWIGAQKHKSYSFIGAKVQRVADMIVDRGGDQALGRYHKIVLAYLALRFNNDFRQHGLPESVAALLRMEFARIVADLAHQDDSFYTFANDLFLKDMGLCTLRLLPCGAELVQVDAGVPRRLLMRGGFLQLARGLYFFLIRSGGFYPMYALHMDPRRKSDFTPEGWDQTYLRIAELLLRHPEVKGVFGTAWFYDPVLENVSPRLAYVRKRREENGAWNFRHGPSTESTNGALATSPTRRRLHEEGKYRPASYYLVWPRDELLRWAETHRRKVVPRDYL